VSLKSTQTTQSVTEKQSRQAKKWPSVIPCTEAMEEKERELAAVREQLAASQAAAVSGAGAAAAAAIAAVAAAVEATTMLAQAEAGCRLTKCFLTFTDYE
jgi:transposase